MEQNQDRPQDGTRPAEGAESVSPPQTFPPFPPLDEKAEARLKHSGPGIASFVIGILNILLVVVGFVVIFAGIAQYLTPEGEFISDDFMENMDASILIGSFMIMGALALSLVGTILGIVAVAVKNRRKVFGIIGLVLNALLLLGVAALMLLGLAMQAAV